jgi:hypothetical protein
MGKPLRERAGRQEGILARPHTALQEILMKRSFRLSSWKAAGVAAPGLIAGQPFPEPKLR